MTRRAAFTAATSVALLAACGGDALQQGPGTVPSAAASGGVAAQSRAGSTALTFRGDDSQMPSFGGWSGSSTLPAEAVAHAGFDWFETGYPGDTQSNEVLANAGVRPFAYVNPSELDDGLAATSGYSGPILRDSGTPNLRVVDVTDPSWQDWLVRRADDAYASGSRGIKWDMGAPDVPPGKTRGDVNNAIASVMQRIRDQHGDMKFIFNQAFEFASAYPQLVDGIETEGLFSASSYPGAYLQPWKDPFYWGPQFQQVKALQQRGVRVFVAEYADPFSDQARQLYEAITGQGFVPYITSQSWNIRGRGLNVNPGW